MRWVFTLIIVGTVTAAALAQGSQGLTPEDRATLHTYQFRISQKVAEGLLIHRVEPDYPADVKASGISGQLFIRFVIGEQGTPKGVLPLSDPAVPSTDNPQIINAALAAVRQWRFKPYLLNGKAIEVETNAVLRFDFSGQNVSSLAPNDPHKPPKKLRASPAVVEGLLIKKVAPLYPQEAKKKHLQGDVVLGYTIDRAGHVINLHVLTGDPLFAQAALDAVKQWVYEPYLLNGEAVEVETVAKISFRM